MSRGTIVLVIFAVIALLIIGASALLQNQPLLEITLAVDPLIEGWARESVTAFNEQAVVVGAGRRVQVNVSTISDFDVWIETVPWNGNTHPDAWLPSSTQSLAYAEERSLPFETIVPSLAKTVLVWAGFSDRVNVLAGSENDPLSWAIVQEAAEQESWEVLGGASNWRFFKLAFNQPSDSLIGLGVIFSAAAAFEESPAITSAQLTNPDFRNWIRPIFNAVNFTIGSNIPAITASRGTSVVDVAVAPESQWLQNLDALAQRGVIRFSDPEYQFVFDFPLARWNDAQTSQEVRAAVDALGRFLEASNQQNQLTAYGLRPVSRTVTQADVLFAEAEPLGIPINRDFEATAAAIIQPPNLTDVRTLLAWIANVR
jgi:hypothetical protein